MTTPLQSTGQSAALPLAWRAYKGFKILGFLLLSFEAYNLALAPAYIETLKAVAATAVADNAAVKQHGEADLAAQKAKIELEVARNAALRQRAEADQAEAEANKSEAEAVTRSQIARNAEQKARSEAEALGYEAATKQQTALVEIEKARVAARLEAAQADKAEATAKLSYNALGSTLASYDMKKCPGKDYMAKVASKVAGRC